MTAHAAMVQAGFRRRSITIPAEDTKAVAGAPKRHFTAGQIEGLLEQLRS
jgi:hypothetical protein